MATGSTTWSTVYEALEATGLSHDDLMRLADEGVVRTSRPGQALLLLTEDVERLAATGSALRSSTTPIEDLRALGRRRAVTTRNDHAPRPRPGGPRRRDGSARQP